MRPSLVLESPFAEDSSTLRFFEPPDIDRFSLWMRVCAGAYDKPFVLDTGPERFLQFDLDAVQSAMRADDPDRLTLAYTRKMMSFLLFKPSPARILLLGLGGGSLAKFCHRRLPGSVMTAVEISGDVIALREEFSVPADDVRFRVVHSDAAAYVAQASPCKDVILSDACDRRGIAPQLDCLEFYANARRCLRPGGIFVINLCGDPCSRGAHLLRLRQVFGDEIFTLQVRRNDNAIALAFNGRRPKLHPGRLQAKATALEHRFGLNFPRFARRLAHEAGLGHWQQVLT